MHQTPWHILNHKVYPTFIYASCLHLIGQTLNIFYFLFGKQLFNDNKILDFKDEKTNVDQLNSANRAGNGPRRVE